MSANEETEWFITKRRLVMDKDDVHGLAMIAHLHEVPEATIQCSKVRERLEHDHVPARSAKGAEASMRAIASLPKIERVSK